MNLRKKIVQKFGSVSAFIKASKADLPWVYRTIRISEEGASQMRSRYNCDKLISLIEETSPYSDPDKLSKDIRMKVDGFFHKRKLSVTHFSLAHNLSRTMIYQIIRGERVNSTDKVKALLKLIEDYENSDAPIPGLKKSAPVKRAGKKKAGVHNAAA